MAHLFFFTGSGGSNAARIASSKTFFNPFCVSAEHSTYFTALSSRANFSAASTVIGFCFTLESFSIVPASSRKSICVPTNKNGVFGQWCVISGTHWKERRNRHHPMSTLIIVVAIGIHQGKNYTGLKFQLMHTYRFVWGNQ